MHTNCTLVALSGTQCTPLHYHRRDNLAQTCCGMQQIRLRKAPELPTVSAQALSAFPLWANRTTQSKFSARWPFETRTPKVPTGSWF